MTDVLGPRALNRAMIERQLLARRVAMGALDAIEHLAGVQAQAPQAPYTGLWARLIDFDPHELGTLIEQRKAVRIAVMRSTIHLLSASDCLAFRPIVQNVVERGLRTGNKGHAGQLSGIDLDELIAAGIAVLERGPISHVDIGRILVERYPGTEPMSLAYAIRGFVPVVQLPPRGVWGKSSKPMLATAESWLGKKLKKTTKPDELFVRYLTAFGPASARDFQQWSGVTALRAMVDRMRPALRTFSSETGVELFDVPDGPLPDADSPVPVRLLPEWDNVLVAYNDRSRVIPPKHHDMVVWSLGRRPVLVDGCVAAFWSIEKSRKAAALEVEPFVAISKKVRVEVEEEGLALLEFLAPATTTRAVRFTA